MWTKISLQDAWDDYVEVDNLTPDRLIECGPQPMQIKRQGQGRIQDFFVGYKNISDQAIKLEDHFSFNRRQTYHAKSSAIFQ